MIVISCDACSVSFRVLEDEFLVGVASEFWPDKYICPLCEETCVAALEGSAEAQKGYLVRDLRPAELFAAMHGMGLPEEIECSASRVKDLLTKPIKSVVGYDVPGTNRFVLEQLVLADGTRLYLGASVHGAVVYRITERHNYTATVEASCD